MHGSGDPRSRLGGIWRGFGGGEPQFKGELTASGGFQLSPAAHAGNPAARPAARTRRGAGHGDAETASGAASVERTASRAVDEPGEESTGRRASGTAGDRQRCAAGFLPGVLSGETVPPVFATSKQREHLKRIPSLTP